MNAVDGQLRRFWIGLSSRSDRTLLVLTCLLLHWMDPLLSAEDPSTFSVSVTCSTSSMHVSLNFPQPFYGLASVSGYYRPQSPSGEVPTADANEKDEGSNCSQRGDGSRQLTFNLEILDKLNEGKCGMALIDGDYAALMTLEGGDDGSDSGRGEDQVSTYLLKCPPHQRRSKELVQTEELPGVAAIGPLKLEPSTSSHPPELNAWGSEENNKSGAMTTGDDDRRDPNWREKRLRLALAAGAIFSVIITLIGFTLLNRPRHRREGTDVRCEGRPAFGTPITVSNENYAVIEAVRSNENGEYIIQQLCPFSLDSLPEPPCIPIGAINELNAILKRDRS